MELRAKWEPLYEVTQIKGDGETHPYLSPNDEFADYETLAKGNLDLTQLKEDDMLQREYAREALKNGFVLENKLGTNPYKFGMVGATDSHTGLSTAEEENFFGKSTSVEPSATRVAHPFVAGPPPFVVMKRVSQWAAICRLLKAVPRPSWFMRCGIRLEQTWIASRS